MEFLPKILILQFNPDTLEAIKKWYNLDQGRMEEALDRMEKWLKKQQHFVKKDFSRAYLERTLIHCKGSVEKAKSQTDKLCTLKTLLPKFFKNCDIKTELRSVTDVAYVIPVPKMTKDHQRVIIIKIHPRDLTAARFIEFYRMNIILCEYLKRHDYIKGVIVIGDYTNVNVLELLAKLSPVEFQQFITILTEGYGARVQSIDILSDSKVINVLINALRQVLPRNMSKRLRVHTNIESLRGVVDGDVLPIEYGGNEISADELNRQWFEILSSDQHMEYMRKMNAACTDETLRNKDTFNEEYLGVPGTFRTLTVD